MNIGYQLWYCFNFKGDVRPADEVGRGLKPLHYVSHYIAS
jgi:hypothetical protein